MIKIKNRYDDEVTFIEIEPNKWSVKTTGGETWGVSGTMEEIYSIDPSGGPYISIGFIIPTTNYKVEKILHDKGFCLITKQIEK